MRRYVLGISLLSSLLCLLFASSMTSALAKSSPVSVTVPDTTLTVQGYSTPGALVTIREGGSIIGSIVADVGGFYSTVLASQASGVRSIQLHYDDVESLRSNIATRSISVQPQQNTTIDAFLSPTIIRRTDQQVQKGSIIQIGGRTIPNAEVTLSLGPTGPFYTATSNASGVYEILVDSANLDDGTYSASVTVSNGIQASEVSRSIGFSVVSPDVGVGLDDTPTFVVVPPDVLPPPVPVTPGDGSVIDADSVTVSGSSVPDAQINIFENGQLIGSIFADDSGEWSFEYQASSSPVTLSFEACIAGQCSVLSINITLIFTGLDSNIADTGVCDLDFHLERYRFWDERTGDDVRLRLDTASSQQAFGVFEIDWGDNTVETFDYDTTQPNNWQYSYGATGSYSGTVTLYQSHDAGAESKCRTTRYFSVHVTTENTRTNIVNVVWLLLILGLISLYYRRRIDNE